MSHSDREKSSEQRSEVGRSTVCLTISSALVLLTDSSGSLLATFSGQVQISQDNITESD